MIIERIKSSHSLLNELSEPFYIILTFEGEVSFSVDYTDYECNGKVLLFLSPFQILHWQYPDNVNINIVKFHGDFYCIEHHKKEVACNGVLFNNIYQQPFVLVEDHIFYEINDIIHKIQNIKDKDNHLNTSILKSYLQLILALSSKEKQGQNIPAQVENIQMDNILYFQKLLEKNFIQNKEVAFYAEQFGLTTNAFSKKIKKHFGKSPTKLIQERTILEAKKLLHLTFKPIKEVAGTLNFEDEFYFSRYFKKEVGVSPKKFREEVGVAFIAK